MKYYIETQPLAVLLSLVIATGLLMILRLLLQNWWVGRGHKIIHRWWAGLYNFPLAVFHGWVFAGALDVFDYVFIAGFGLFLSLSWLIFDLLWNVRNHGWAGWNYVDDPDEGEDDAVLDVIFHKVPWLQIVVKILFVIGFSWLLVG